MAPTSVRSRVTLENPSNEPAGSRIAVMTTFAQKRVPLLAHAPAFVLEAAFSGGNVQIAIGAFRARIHRARRTREMRADDLRHR